MQKACSIKNRKKDIKVLRYSTRNTNTLKRVTLILVIVLKTRLDGSIGNRAPIGLVKSSKTENREPYWF